MSTTINYLQEYIKSKDNHPRTCQILFLQIDRRNRRAVGKNKIRIDNSSVKGTIDEEIYNVIYYVIAIANCYDIDLEKTIKYKEKINAKKYNSDLF